MHGAIARGNVAVVTGAASGIGLAAARRLGEAGMHVVLADLPGEALDRAAEGLAAAGIAATACATDVSQRTDVAALKDRADAVGPVTLVMSNAGREGGGEIFAGEDVWRRTLEVNLWGSIHALQLFGPDMIARDRPGALVFTGSKQGITLPPGDTAYNVSKAALKALAESAAHELHRSTGARVSAHLLIPGFTYTGFTRARGIDEKPAGAWTGEQVADFMLERMTAGDFYILCPDNEADRATDLKRMRWSFGDILEDRPALSRWHADHADAFKRHMSEG